MNDRIYVCDVCMMACYGDQRCAIGSTPDPAASTAVHGHSTANVLDGSTPVTDPAETRGMHPLAATGMG